VFGYLWGAHPNLNNTSELAQEQTALGKDFSFVRDFRADWGTPGTRVATWNNEHKIVAWSVKPPIWSGTCGAWNSTPAPNGTCPNGGTTPWALAAADTATMRSMVQSLQNTANAGGVPFNTITISHEPHDNAIDDKGWNFGSGGSSNIKCGRSDDPSQTTFNPNGSVKYAPCLGTRNQFKALYSALRQARDTACNSSGGTSGTLGYKCSKVLIQYIAVPLNMVNKVSARAPEMRHQGGLPTTTPPLLCRWPPWSTGPQEFDRGKAL
jgi:hypothetical protein